jgi:glutathionylspermidine synthase
MTDAEKAYRQDAIEQRKRAVLAEHKLEKLKELYHLMFDEVIEKVLKDDNL